MEEQKTESNPNEMTLIYKSHKSEISIFGGEFESRYINSCYLLIDREKKDM